jgi:hypothetical protein
MMRYYISRTKSVVIEDTGREGRQASDGKEAEEMLT